MADLAPAAAMWETKTDRRGERPHAMEAAEFVGGESSVAGGVRRVYKGRLAQRSFEIRGGGLRTTTKTLTENRPKRALCCVHYMLSESGGAARNRHIRRCRKQRKRDDVCRISIPDVCADGGMRGEGDGVVCGDPCNGVLFIFFECVDFSGNA